MKATNHEGDHEQTCHRPKCVVEPRILVGIMVRGMREVAGELAVCPGVTLLTRLDNVVSMKMGSGICHRQDVMSTVAIIAFGGLRVPQLRDLAMVSIEVGFRNSLMAPAALLHDVKFESVLIRARNGMCRMAIAAHRGPMLCRVGHRCMNACDKLLLDPVVTAAACRGNVLSVYAGG